MKNQFALYRPIFLVLAVLFAGSLVLTLVSGSLWMCIVTVLVAIAAGVILYLLYKLSANLKNFLEMLGSILAPLEQETITSFPFPIMVTDAQDQIIWYNNAAREVVFNGEEMFSKEFPELFPSVKLQEPCPAAGYHVEYREKMYTAYTNIATDHEAVFHIVYMIEDTKLKNLAREYYLSKPSVLLIMVDNYEDLLQNARENERSQVMSKIERLIENFVFKNEGFCRRLERDKFIAVIEERYMKEIIESRFILLDEVRHVVTANRMAATLSIGVGRDAKTLTQGEEMARQALDMALGRGGDQAAVKNRTGYEFYGGVSKGVEKRTKVKTRIVAAALSKLIAESDNVLLMGHRFADLDCFGACIGLCGAVRRMGKTAYVVVNEEKNLAKPLFHKFAEAGLQNFFVDPVYAKELISRGTLLIIADTHIPHILESEEIYRACQTVVVIDHHRKMVDYIDNAVIFYHEPYASSASEMITELIQYFGDNTRMNAIEAEALLAGIMLDTKNFIIRTGVRTFEAAAYLRQMGADTTEVRRLFSSTMESYQKRSRLVASAEVYKRCAIAYTTTYTDDIKIVAPQAADELLNINDVDASFVMYGYDNGVAFCARSMGEINVQVIMERLGGGGHHTMAGAQVDGLVMEDARQSLLEAIDEYYKNQQK